MLTEGAGLVGTSMQVIAGWFDPDEQQVPFDMFAGGCRASAREGLITHYKIGYLIDLGQKGVTPPFVKNCTLRTWKGMRSSAKIAR